MAPNLWTLYRQMLRSRLFEEAVIRLWNEGKISGEMHLGIGEEAIAAGVVSELTDGDAMALDHRGTPQCVMRGIDSVILLKEFLGHQDGLCRGMGGHMHLFSKEHLVASSGIVGASGPSAAGFAMSAQHLRPKSVSVAFFGEGAMNQGMMLEAMNLASVWKLPVIFICKNNNWAITTRSESVTAGDLKNRAKSFGMVAKNVNGSDVAEVNAIAHQAIKRARKGKGPSFIHAHCVHPEGHFLGDALLRIARHPVDEMKQVSGPLLKSFTKKNGASVWQRSASLGTVTNLIGKTTVSYYWKKDDPLAVTRKKLKKEKEKLKIVEDEAKKEIDKIVETALVEQAAE